MDYRWHPSWGQTGPVDNRITDTRVPRRISPKVEFYRQREAKDRLTGRQGRSCRHLSMKKSRLCRKERDNHIFLPVYWKREPGHYFSEGEEQQRPITRLAKLTDLHFVTKKLTRSKLCNTSVWIFLIFCSITSCRSTCADKRIDFWNYRSASFTSGRSIIMTLHLNPICCPTSQT